MAPTDALIAASELATRFVDDLPVVYRDDPDVRAVLYAGAKFIEELDAAVDRLKANMLPHTADADGLSLWEAALNLTVNPSSLTTEERRTAVLTFFRASNDGTGLGWESVVDYLLKSGSWSYEEHEPGLGPDDGYPAAYTVVVRPPFPPSSDVYERLRRLLAIVTPANLDLDITGEGFFLDDSQLDDEELG